MINTYNDVTIVTGSFVQIGEMELEYDGDDNIVSDIQVHIPNGTVFTQSDIIFVEECITKNTANSVVRQCDVILNMDKAPLFTNPLHDDPYEQKIVISITHPSDREDIIFVVHRYRREIDHNLYESYKLNKPNSITCLYTISNSILKDWSLQNIFSRISNEEARQIKEQIFG